MKATTVRSWPRAVRDAGRSGLRVERASLSPLLALRGAWGVGLVLGVALWLGDPGLAISSAFGAFAAGIATFQRSFRPRPVLALAAAAGLSVSAFLGYVLAGYPVFFVAMLALWACGAGMMWAFGAVTGVVAGLTVAVMLVVVTLPSTVPEAAQHAGIIALGGLLQAALVVLFPVRRWGAQRDALADALAGVADYARRLREHPTAHFDPQPLMDAHSAAEMTSRQARRRPAQLSGYRTLAERYRPVLAALADPAFGGAAVRGPERERVNDLLRAVGVLLDATARAIRRGEDISLPAETLEVLKVPADGPALPPGPARKAALRLIALSEEAVDAAGGPVEVTSHGGEHRIRPRFGPGALRVTLRTLRRETRWSSPVFRHALRLSGVVVSGFLLGELLPPEHGYWIALTVVMVLRPDFTGTVGRGAARLVGTTAGVAVGGTVLAVLHPGAHVSAALSLLSVFLLYLLIRTGYTVISACAGAYVVFLLGVAGEDWAQTVPERVALTVLGGLLALVSYALFPSWETPRLRERLADWTAASATYAATVLAACAHPRPQRGSSQAQRAEHRAREALLDVRAARLKWEATTDRAADEPVRHRGLSRRGSAEAHDALITLGRVTSLLEAQLPHHDQKAGLNATSSPGSASEAEPTDPTSTAVRSGGGAEQHDPGAEQFAMALASAAEPEAEALRRGDALDWRDVRLALEEWQKNTARGDSVALRVAELVVDALEEVAVAVSPGGGPKLPRQDLRGL